MEAGNWEQMRREDNPDGAARGQLKLGVHWMQTVLGLVVAGSLLVLVVLLGPCTVGTEGGYAVEVEALPKVWAFVVELVLVDKMAVVGFDHPAEQTAAEGLGWPVEVGPWEL